MTTKEVLLQEVGPREGFQFEGIGDPGRISTEAKVRLVDSLAGTGLRRIQVTSFVSPRQVPQMADAAEVSGLLRPRDGVEYTSLFFNERGLRRAIEAGVYTVVGQVVLTASETFSQRNLRTDHAGEVRMQRSLLEAYRACGVPVTRAAVMAAFGCNYEGSVPLGRVLELLAIEEKLIVGAGGRLEEISLADTMGWADPEQVRVAVETLHERWPDTRVSLHLHDTRGTGMANVYAALMAGVDALDTSVGGLGGCPFAGTAAGNVPTEDVVFLCDRLGVRTGVDLEPLLDSVRVAEETVGHPLPGRVGRLSIDLLQ